MNAELKAKWVEALRSGKYKQGRDGLRSTSGQHCCLGVLCDVINPAGWSSPREFIFEGDQREMFLPDALAKRFGIEFETQSELAALNDDGTPFAAIADWIEQNIPADETAVQA